MNAVAALFIAVFPLLVIVAALKDVTSFTIPNWISVGLFAAFFPAALAVGAPLPLIGTAVLVGVCALAVGMGLFAMNVLGGGDAKLLAACALWMGWPVVLPFVLMTAIAGGVLALFILRMRAAALQALIDRSPLWVQRIARSGDAPYGVAIAIGGLMLFPQTPLVERLAG